MNFESIYEALLYMGMDPRQWIPNYQDDDGDLALAIPESLVGVAVQGNSYDSLVKAGWSVVSLQVRDLEAFSRVWTSLKEMQVQWKTNQSAASMIKTGSEAENMMYAAIIRAGIPEPDRNYVLRREDGKELAVPDFAWPHLKLAFFMDGIWWHHGKDSKERKDAILSKDEKVLDAAHKLSQSRMSRDHSNRSEMQAMGWRTLSCTDEHLSTPDGVARQVKVISDMIARLRLESSWGKGSPGSPPTVHLQGEARSASDEPVNTGIRPARLSPKRASASQSGALEVDQGGTRAELESQGSTSAAERFKAAVSRAAKS